MVIFYYDCGLVALYYCFITWGRNFPKMFSLTDQEVMMMMMWAWPTRGVGEIALQTLSAVVAAGQV